MLSKWVSGVITMAAIYQADVWCDDCANCIKDRIVTELWDNRENAECPDGIPVTDFDSIADLRDYLDSVTFDSDDYPQYCSDDEECDSPQHCAAHEECFNAIDLGDYKVGYFFGNSLTTDGEDYVRQAVIDGGLVSDLWADHYSYLDFSYSLDEAVAAGHAVKLIGDEYGDQMPRQFSLQFLADNDIEDGDGWSKLLDSDRDVLNVGPEHQFYWPVWNDVVEFAVYTDSDGCKWKLLATDDDSLFVVKIFLLNRIS